MRDGGTRHGRRRRLAARAAARRRPPAELRGGLHLAGVHGRDVPDGGRHHRYALRRPPLRGRARRHRPLAAADRDRDARSSRPTRRRSRSRSRTRRAPCSPRRPVAPYPAGRAPWSAFVNGTPERRTGSDEEWFAVSPPHYRAAAGAPGRHAIASKRARWRPLSATRLDLHRRCLRLGRHRVVGAHGERRGDDRAVVPAGASCACPRRLACVPRHGRRMLVSAAPRPHRPADAVGLADRPGDPARAHGRKRRRHLRHRRLPDDAGRDARAAHRRGRRQRFPTRRRSATSTWPGRTTARTAARPPAAAASRPRRSATSTSATRRSAGSTSASSMP